MRDLFIKVTQESKQMFYGDSKNIYYCSKSFPYKYISFKAFAFFSIS